MRASQKPRFGYTYCRFERTRANALRRDMSCLETRYAVRTEQDLDTPAEQCTNTPRFESKFSEMKPIASGRSRSKSFLHPLTSLRGRSFTRETPAAVSSSELGNFTCFPAQLQMAPIFFAPSHFTSLALSDPEIHSPGSTLAAAVSPELLPFISGYGMKKDVNSGPNCARNSFVFAASLAARSLP